MDSNKKLQDQIQEETEKLISLITEDPILHELERIFDGLI